MGPQPAEEPITRISVFLTERQLDRLRAINQETGVPVSVLIRRGVDWVLSQHAPKGPTRTTRRKNR